MKSEERILELLAEYLHKTDRLLDKMTQTDKNMAQTDRNIDIMSKAMLDHSLKFNKINEEIKRLTEDQRIMLKELLSISKRVSSLEDKA